MVVGVFELLKGSVGVKDGREGPRGVKRDLRRTEEVRDKGA